MYTTTAIWWKTKSKTTKYGSTNKKKNGAGCSSFFYYNILQHKNVRGEVVLMKRAAAGLKNDMMNLPNEAVHLHENMTLTLIADRHV